MKKFACIMLFVTVCSGILYGQTQQSNKKGFPSKGVTQEVWEGIKTDKMEEFKKHKAFIEGNPSFAKVVDKLDIDEMGDQYGSRYTAYITPSKNGEYTFWLSADDMAELYISSDETEEKAEKIASLNSYTSPKSFHNRGKSEPVKLEAGKKYYICVLHKEANGADHLAVAWSSPDMERTIITSDNLQPYIDSNRGKALEKTFEREKKQSELEKKFSSLPAKEVPEYLNSLSVQDNNLLSKRFDNILKEAVKLDDKKALAVLAPYIRQAQSIKASAETPVKNLAAKKLLYMEEMYLMRLSPGELKKLGAHRLASSLGEISKGVKTISKAGVKLNSEEGKHRAELVSTGFYAFPGVPFKITIPEVLADKGLNIQVGHHIIPNNEKADLVSMPHTTRKFPLTGKTSEFITPHGGLILLDVPAKVGLSNDEIIMEKVILAPRFVLGETTDEEWSKIKENPAPWGELVSEHLTLIVQREALRDLKNPTELMSWWNENNRRHEDFYGYYPKVAFRMHAALYAREGISYWPLEWQSKNIVGLLDIEKMKKVNSPLYLHEHGHHADFGDMEFGYISESTPNWAGYYMKASTPFDWKDDPTVHLVKLMDPNNEEHNEIKQPDWYKISTKGTHHWSYPVTSMMLAYTEDFGWEPFKKTIHRLRDRQDEMYNWPFTERKTDDQAKIDRYLIGLSQEAKYDVRPYFAHFYLLPSEGAAAFLDKLALPKWDSTHLPPPVNSITKTGQPLTIPNPDKTALTMAGEVKITWEQPENGKVDKQENGDLLYTPKEGFSGMDRIPYVMTTPIGTSPRKYVIITVEPQ